MAKNYTLDKIAEIIQEKKYQTQQQNYIHSQHTSAENITHIYIKHHNRNIHKKLSYKGITDFYSDKKKGLKQPMLNAETIGNLESDSQPDLDIQFQQAIDEEDSSDQSTLQNIKKKAIKRKNTSP